MAGWLTNSQRFIPACAGNSDYCRRHVLLSAVHPRLRGELSPLMVNSFRNPGSSPLARGTQCGRAKGLTNARFIPACAGNSKMQTEITTACSVHPRLRGELRLLKHCVSLPHGSSPLARGTPSAKALRFAPARFIPACAGNSEARTAIPTLSPVHPRLRGELCKREFDILDLFGSSPLARGTQGFGFRHQ